MTTREQLAGALAAHVDPSGILTDDASLNRYGADQSRLGVFRPDVVALPATEREVSAVMRVAAETRTPVTPRGGGSGLTGGALPVDGGIALSLERMNAILDIDAEARVARVQAGVVTGDLVDRAEAAGLFYPPSPNSLRLSTIGGNLAHNASGPRSLKYGAIQDYVLGARVALIGGDVVEVGSGSHKGFTGYNMAGLLVGSEGTLGVATEISLSLLRLPPARATLVVEFIEVRDAVRAAQTAIATGLDLAALDLVGAFCTRELAAAGEFAFRSENPNALLIELDGAEATVAANLQACRDVFASHPHTHAYTLRSAAEQAQVWQARRAVFGTMIRSYPGLVVEDMCVPVSRIHALVDRLHALADQHDVPWAALGNVGEGNLHVGALFDERGAQEQARAQVFFRELLGEVSAMGGSLSFEHGISYKKREAYCAREDAALIDLQRRLKSAFDPMGLLNPGKIFA